jgi:gliding motility-associated protein GldM
MAGGKLPPRQKMIGMMYLVLTALLAMNVSKDILNAFVTVNDGLEKTKLNFASKNDDQYTAFEASYSENKAKVAPFYNKAKEVQTLADEIVTYIDNIKIEIIAGIEPSVAKENIRGKNAVGEDTLLNLMAVKVKDNYIYSTNLLVGSEPSTPKSGEYSAMELKGKLENFRDVLLQKVPEGGVIAGSLKETFSFEEKRTASGVMENWPAYNFYGVPAAATITLLTKMQTDVRNAESDAIKFLYASVDAASYKFNVLESAVISPSNYIILGDTFQAEVFLAAFDSTKNPQVFLGDKYDSTNQTVTGDTINVDVRNGKGYIKIPTRSEGEYAYEGVIKYKAPSGEINSYPFKAAYQVAKPSTTVSATKMNVFYIGVPNPVDISAPGVAKDKIRASITNGSITKAAGGGWTVNVKKIGDAKISVTADVDGTSKNMGTTDFRVKQIPTPTAKIGGQASGSMRKVQLEASSGIRADLENFDFDVKVVVSSYTMGYTKSNGLLDEVKVNGNRFNGEVKSKIGGMGRNSRVFFDDIKVQMPDGTTRTLPPVNLKLI